MIVSLKCRMVKVDQFYFEWTMEDLLLMTNPSSTVPTPNNQPSAIQPSQHTRTKLSSLSPKKGC